MKIYFAGSIRAGRNDVGMYSELINHLKKYGEVLTEHVGDKKLAVSGGNCLNDEFIHDRDLRWLFSSDVVVAEVSTPSLGVGYEIGRAVERKKSVLCLHRLEDGKMLSAMISGCPNVSRRNYKTLEEARLAIDDFFKSLDNSTTNIRI